LKKVLIDLTSIYGRKITGLEIYGINLYQALLFKDYIEVIPIFSIKNTVDGNTKCYIINSTNRVLLEQLYLPNLIRKVQPDIVLYPVFPPGFLTYLIKDTKTKIVPTIHDTVMWKYYNTLSRNAKLYLRPSYNYAIDNADSIITISETVKKELSVFTDKKILNFSNCISEKYNKIDNIETSIIKILNLETSNYILSVATIEPRKNLIYLIKIYKKLLENGFDKKLVLVGRYGWGDNTELKNILEDLKNNVVFTNFISDDDLITLYKNCHSFYLLSLYEGFGRPPLEALACGSQVFVSDIPIFHEVLKTNATYLPLEDVSCATNIILREQNRKNQEINNEFNFEKFQQNIDIRKIHD